jgi:hypothetical protein
MAAFNKFNAFVENLSEGVHNLGSDALTVALSNTLPTAANSVLTDITQISYTGLSSRTLVTASSAQVAGTYKLILNDLVLTATATVGPFRYVIIYNETPTNKNLIGWYDIGSSITLNTGESLTLDFDNTNGVLTLA